MHLPSSVKKGLVVLSLFSSSCKQTNNLSVSASHTSTAPVVLPPEAQPEASAVKLLKMTFPFYKTSKVQTVRFKNSHIITHSIKDKHGELATLVGKDKPRGTAQTYDKILQNDEITLAFIPDHRGKVIQEFMMSKHTNDEKFKFSRITTIKEIEDKKKTFSSSVESYGSGMLEVQQIKDIPVVVKPKI